VSIRADIFFLFLFLLLLLFFFFFFFFLFFYFFFFLFFNVIRSVNQLDYTEAYLGIVQANSGST